jgi:hypothetical protein
MFYFTIKDDVIYEYTAVLLYGKDRNLSIIYLPHGFDLQFY